MKSIRQHIAQLDSAYQPPNKLLVAGALVLTSLVTLGAPAQASEVDAQALKQARNRMLVGATLLQERSLAYDGTTPFSMAFIARGAFSSIKTRLECPMRSWASATMMRAISISSCRTARAIPSRKTWMTVLRP